MKKILFIIFTLFFYNIHAQSIKGAWISKNEEETTIILATDNYFVANTYDRNCLIETKGGKYSLSRSNEIFIDFDFYSNLASIVGSTQSYNLSIKKKNLDFEGKKFSKLDHQTSLEGRWKYPNAVGKDYLIIEGNYFIFLKFNNATAELFDCVGGQIEYVSKDVYKFTNEFSLNDATLIHQTKELKITQNETELLINQETRVRLN